ncbi:agmatine deiminase family protein [Vibrio maritimus]|uniref:agmatine deiminase family protein n=1 Tax=Vibrio maritimus TaxID=990268 RepID=UPI001F3D8C03|nr:agmatine deiminase family protein [Vibrio maritimus]
MKKPMSSVYGEIKRMLLTYPKSNPLPNDITLQRYKGIFESLGNNIEYIILADNSAHQSIKQTALNSGLDPDTNLNLINARVNYPAHVNRLIRQISGNIWECELESSWHSIWAQDGYCCLKDDEGNSILIEPLDFTRNGDNFVAEQIAARTNIQVEVTKYHIEGGNILAGDNYVIVGSDYLHYNRKITGETDEQITSGFQELFGVENIIWLGFDNPVNFPIDVFQGTYQPIFHIDMYITLGGKSENGRELIFVGDVNLAKSVLEQESPLVEIASSFDKTAEWLSGYSQNGIEFEVVRIPLDLWNISNSQGTFLSYNNCIIEVFGEAKNVYVPSYSSVAPGSINRRKLDETVASIFNEHGFNVTMLSGAYEELCKNGGSVHCITKVLDRE